MLDGDIHAYIYRSGIILDSGSDALSELCLYAELLPLLRVYRSRQPGRHNRRYHNPYNHYNPVSHSCLDLLLEV